MAQIASVVTNGCDPDTIIREARWLVELGHEVTVRTLIGLKFAASEKVDGVLIQRYRVENTYRATIRTWLGIRRFLKKVAPKIRDVDLVHLHDADTRIWSLEFKPKEIV